MTFKAGDIVKCIELYSNFTKDREYVVHGVCYDGYSSLDNCLLITDDTGSTNYRMSYRFEKVKPKQEPVQEPFHVGDTVRCVESSYNVTVGLNYKVLDVAYFASGQVNCLVVEGNTGQATRTFASRFEKVVKPVQEPFQVGDTVRCIADVGSYNKGDTYEVVDVRSDKKGGISTITLKGKYSLLLCFWPEYFEKVLDEYPTEEYHNSSTLIAPVKLLKEALETCLEESVENTCFVSKTAVEDMLKILRKFR